MARTSTSDHYKTLGVKTSASSQEIKKRYRELAKKYHPDANNGSKKAENKFKTISVAYEILSDKKKRHEYDRERTYKHQRTQRTRQDPSAWTDPNWEEEFHEPRTEYRQDFSGTTTEEPYKPDPDAPTGGFDLQFIIEVPFVTVALGGTAPYNYEKYVNCPDCEGTGSNGDGECPGCSGKRQVVQQVDLDVKIPPGVADQYTLRFQNEGGEGRNGGPPGDLFLRVQTLPQPGFKRVKNDIQSTVHIARELAENGGPLEVKTLDSVTTVQVEEGTLTGEEMRIPGEGAAILWGKKRGDLIVKFFIEDQ